MQKKKKKFRQKEKKTCNLKNNLYIQINQAGNVAVACGKALTHIDYIDPGRLLSIREYIITCQEYGRCFFYFEK